MRSSFNYVNVYEQNKNTKFSEDLLGNIKRIPPQADLRQLDGAESSMSPENISAKYAFMARQLCANR
jgi:hypothetical protein